MGSTLVHHRERFDDFILLFNHQSLSMRKNGSNDILPLKLPPDEIRRTIDLNVTMRVDFADKGNSSFCNRDTKVTLGIHVLIEAESSWQMSKRFPEAISEYAGQSCAVFILGKPSMWFLIMVIPQKAFTSLSKDSKGRTMMASNHSFLPEFIKTLNRCIPTWFSLRDKYQMYPHEQVETHQLRDAPVITSSSCSRHLVVHLRHHGNAHISPHSNQMFAQRDCLFIRKLGCESCMPRNIHRMKRIESGNPFWTSKMSGTHKVCLVEVSHLTLPCNKDKAVYCHYF